MKKYLLCYEVGITVGHVSGCMFFTMSKLTEESLAECAQIILEKLQKEQPQYDHKCVVWRSVNLLDA